MGSQASLKTALPQYPLITDFGEEHGFPLYEIKDGSLLEVEKVSLQQRLNQFQHEVSPCLASQQPSSLSFLLLSPCPQPHQASALPKSASALSISMGNRVGEVWEPLCSLTLAHLSGPPQLQKNKEQEEQLGEMIQAYEKLCVEKSDLETELGEMVRPRVGVRYSVWCDSV